ncbi:caspase recruitment domain-containing protein 8 isoform X8, partial [Silurus asotus]
DIQLFTPELVKKCTEEKNSEEYRFLCPHAGQFKCKLTNLVFEMEAKSVVKYRIVSWDKHVLDVVSQMDPAGPLYDIDCLEGSIRHLSLPHCETHKKLAVAHVTDGNMEIIQPLNVTNTHVIINIPSFSLFGLIKSLVFKTYPISAQVLLFHDKMVNKLHIHLMPENVPVGEVQKRHESNTYITTTSKCQLKPGEIYRPCCKTPDSCNNIECQPEEETFELDYGPNFHPTFEILFDTEVYKVTLSILDVEAKEVWKPRAVKLRSKQMLTCRFKSLGAAYVESFVDKHREQFIQRVSSVMEIADGLKSRNMISDEMYNNIRVEPSSYKQMRLVYDALHSGGGAVKAEFYKILKEKHPHLVDDLESGSSR